MKRNHDRVLAEAGEAMVAAAFGVGDSGDRLDAVLDVLAALADAPVHLYTCQHDGGTLSLVRSSAPPRLGATRPTSAAPRRRRGRPSAEQTEDEWVDGPGWDEGSDLAQTTLSPTLPGGTVNRPTAVSPAGEASVLPLRVGMNPARGLVLVGPPTHPDIHQLDSGVRVPLTAALTAILDEEQFGRRLAIAEAKQEAGTRLQQSAVDTERFCDLSLRLALRATGAESAVLDTFGDEPRRLAIDLDPVVEAGLDMSPRADVLDWETAVDGGPVLVQRPEVLLELGVRSLLALPMMHDGSPIGVVALVNTTSSLRFGPEAVSILATLAEQTNLMLASEEMMARFHERYLATLRGLAETLDARRPWLGGHHARVGALAGVVARLMDVDRDSVAAVTLAGHLHDIGLAGVVELGDGRQADFEHPALGAALVERLPLHPDVAAAVLTHHEWFDGWGFPAGLSGDDLPMSGRILALAEFAVESTTTDPVHAAWTIDRVASELRTRRGSQFAPEVVDAALSHLDSPDLARCLVSAG